MREPPFDPTSTGLVCRLGIDGRSRKSIKTVGREARYVNLERWDFL